jgi:hypothetical protein
MKSIVLTLLTTGVTLFAQQSDPIPRSAPLTTLPNSYPRQGMQSATNVFPDNYALVLTITDKNAAPAEIELVVASPYFQAALGESNLSFSGSISIADAESAIVTFQLGWQAPVSAGKDSTQLVASNMQGSVRLKMGDDVQVMRAGSKGARLSIRKLETPKVK